MRSVALAALAALMISPATASPRTGAIACDDLSTSIQIERAPDASARAQMVANEVKAGKCRVYKNTACLVPGEARQGYSCMKEGASARSCRWINVDAALDRAGQGRACS